MKQLKLSARTVTAILAVVVLAVAAGAVAYATSRGSHATATPGTAAHQTGQTGQTGQTRQTGQTTANPANGTVTFGSGTVGQPIPSGYVGLTTEYRGLEGYAGNNPAALDPVFEQLIRNLAPGQSPVLRIGGDSTDWTWYPIPHMTPPGGIKFSLDKTWLGVASNLAKAVGARLILGINLEADSGRIAAAEAHGLINGVGRARIAALELGNEPELYATFPWYKLPSGQHVRGRPPTYTYASFVRDFASVSRAIPRSTTLAGPSMGAPMWIPLLGQFLSGNRRVGLATLHRYPLKHCSAATHITVPEILADSSSTGLAASVAGAVAASHARHVPLRVDEMSAISCGGVNGVSHSFATGLWALDALFAMARVGVDGVNMQTAPGSWNELFGVTQSKSGWSATVYPAYYGMMMFAQAAPPGSRLLKPSGSLGAGVHVWATRAGDGTVRVTLINETSGSRSVTVHLPAQTVTATLERLQAPSASATQGVTLDGQSFGPQTRTGQLAGTSNLTFVKPTTTGYTITLTAASAALLSVAAK
jgi:hypothetical protein